MSRPEGLELRDFELLGKKLKNSLTNRKNKNIELLGLFRAFRAWSHGVQNPTAKSPPEEAAPER